MILLCMPNILETSSRLKTHEDQNLHGRSQVEEAENSTVKYLSHSWTWTFPKKVVQWPGKHSGNRWTNTFIYPVPAVILIQPKGSYEGKQWCTNKTEETLRKHVGFLARKLAKRGYSSNATLTRINAQLSKLRARAPKGKNTKSFSEGSNSGHQVLLQKTELGRWEGLCVY